jgi:hypothetical protein
MGPERRLLRAVIHPEGVGTFAATGYNGDFDGPCSCNPQMSRRGDASKNPVYDIDLEGFLYQFPSGLFQALKVRRCHMLIERSLTFPYFVKIETSPRV